MVQGCEHLNRALAVECELAESKGIEMVDVLPSLYTGGSGQLVTFKYPVEFEEIVANSGLDIAIRALGRVSNVFRVFKACS